MSSERDDRGISRVLNKLENSVSYGNYLEAHQMYGTRYFEKKFDNNENILKDKSYDRKKVEENGVDHTVAANFVKILTSSRRYAFKSCNVCVFCVFNHVNSSAQVNDYDYEINNIAVYTNDAYANAVAKIHNKEMHSLNGNIDRSTIVNKLKSTAWNREPIKIQYRLGNQPQFERFRDNVETYEYVNSRNMAFRFIDNTGTNQQQLMSHTALRAVSIPEYNAPEIQEPPADADDEARQIYEQQLVEQAMELELNLRAIKQLNLAKTSREEFANYIAGIEWTKTPSVEKAITSRALWASVGFGFIEHGKIRINGASSRIPVIMSEIQNGIGDFGHDWRSLALKTSLYEMQLDPSWTDPTGSDYRFAVGGTRHTGRVKKTGPNQRRLVVLSISALEAHFRKHYAVTVDISLERDETKTEKWCLIGTTKKLIFLDDRLSTIPATQALWILCHLTYPLMETYDVYNINTHGGMQANNNTAENAPTSDYFVYRRTASLVEINELDNDIILVVTDQVMQEISIAGIKLNVQRARRFHEPLTAVPFIDGHQLIEACLDAIIAYGQNLRILLHNYLLPIMSQGMNWGEIEQIVGILTTRYIPKDEVRVLSANTYHLKSNWVTHTNLIEIRNGETWESSSFTTDNGHSAVVNAFDQPFAPRSVANFTSLIIIGRWNNMSELAVMCGAADISFNCESARTYDNYLQTSSLDKIIRSRYLRSAIEEWKEASGTTDELLNLINIPDLNQGVGMLLNGSPAPYFYVGLKELCQILVGGESCRWEWHIISSYATTPTATGIRLGPTTKTNAITDGIMVDDNLKVTISGVANSWRYYKVYPTYDDDDPMIDKHLYKIDALFCRRDITQMEVICLAQVHTWEFLVEASSRLRLMQAVHLKPMYVNSNENNVSWGYHIKNATKCWTDGIMKKVVLSHVLYQAMIFKRVDRQIWYTKTINGPGPIGRVSGF